MYVDLQKLNKSWQWYIAYWTEGPKTLRRGVRGNYRFKFGRGAITSSYPPPSLSLSVARAFSLSFSFSHLLLLIFIISFLSLFAKSCSSAHSHSLSPSFFPFISNNPLSCFFYTFCFSIIHSFMLTLPSFSSSAKISSRNTNGQFYIVIVKIFFSTSGVC